MNLNLLKKTALCLALPLSMSVATFAQGFEGTIEFKQFTAKDTTLNLYYVKGNKVKLDQLGKTSHKAEGSFLFDLSANKIIGVNHSRKVYDDVPVSKNPAANKIDTVIKLKDTKTIQGIKCQGFIVKSKGDNAQITFWLAPGNYQFFESVVTLWNRKDKASVYFRAIKDTKGMLPMLSVEADLSGKEQGKLEVIKIEKKAIDAATLEIPKDYKQFK